MGRTKGSKNGVRKVPIRKLKIKKELITEIITENEYKDKITTENYDLSLPVFDAKVLKAYKNRHYGKCIEMIDRILNNNTDENKDHYKILQAGALTMLGKEIDKAHLVLDEVLKFAPMNASALYAKGVAFYFEKKMDESVKMFDKALESDSSHEMEKARDMKMRIDLERRQVVIMVEKMEEKVEKKVPEAHEVLEMKMQSNEDVEMADVEKENAEKIADIIGVPATKSSEVFHEQNDENIQVKNGKVTTMKTPETFKKLEDEKITSEDTKTSASLEPIPDIPESLPKSFKPKTAEEFYLKGMELYLSGSLKKSLKMFEKSMEIDPTFTKSDDMGTKAQEYLELVDTTTINMTLKNYAAVVEIVNEALEVDASNLYINRPFYFQRGLALFHLGRNEESLRDYAEFDRINKILNED